MVGLVRVACGSMRPLRPSAGVAISLHESFNCASALALGSVAPFSCTIFMSGNSRVMPDHISACIIWFAHGICFVLVYNISRISSRILPLVDIVSLCTDPWTMFDETVPGECCVGHGQATVAQMAWACCQLIQ